MRAGINKDGFFSEGREEQTAPHIAVTGRVVSVDGGRANPRITDRNCPAAGGIIMRYSYKENRSFRRGPSVGATQLEPSRMVSSTAFRLPGSGRGADGEATLQRPGDRSWDHRTL